MNQFQYELNTKESRISTKSGKLCPYLHESRFPKQQGSNGNENIVYVKKLSKKRWWWLHTKKGYQKGYFLFNKDIELK